MQEYLDSLELLKNYDIDYFAPGHGNYMQEPIKTIDSIIRHRLTRESKVLRCVGNNNKSNVVKDSHVLQTMRYLELLKEFNFLGPFVNYCD